MVCGVLHHDVIERCFVVLASSQASLRLIVSSNVIKCPLILSMIVKKYLFQVSYGRICIFDREEIPPFIVVVVFSLGNGVQVAHLSVLVLIFIVFIQSKITRLHCTSSVRSQAIVIPITTIRFNFESLIHLV